MENLKAKPKYEIVKDLLRGDEVSWSTVRAPRILVIDDDPSFLKIMEKLGKQAGVNIHCCHSWTELLNLKKDVGEFDGAVVDYYLDQTKGIYVANYIERSLGSFPILMVSQQYAGREFHNWVHSIRGFVHKKEGHREILRSILEITDLLECS